LTEQLAYAQGRFADALKNGRANLRLLDYRDIEGRYDPIASIEMIEAVGERYWPVYFAKLRASLRIGGIALLQAITIDESHFAAYRNRADFIQRHIFPGGLLPTASIIGREAERAGLKLVHGNPSGTAMPRHCANGVADFSKRGRRPSRSALMIASGACANIISSIAKSGFALASLRSASSNWLARRADRISLWPLAAALGAAAALGGEADIPI
jgi:hypothetical protein